MGNTFQFQLSWLPYAGPPHSLRFLTFILLRLRLFQNRTNHRVCFAPGAMAEVPDYAFDFPRIAVPGYVCVCETRREPVIPLPGPFDRVLRPALVSCLPRRGRIAG